MNRDDRSKMMIRTRQFMLVVAEQCANYREFLEETLQTEENKLSNIPDSLIDCDNSNQISESLDVLELAIDTIEEISVLLDQLPDQLNIKMRKSRQKIHQCHEVYQPESYKPLETSEKRSKRLQLVVTPSLEYMLKFKSSAMGISSNELINRILFQNLNTVNS